MERGSSEIPTDEARRLQEHLAAQNIMEETSERLTAQANQPLIQETRDRRMMNEHAAKVRGEGQMSAEELRAREDMDKQTAELKLEDAFMRRGDELDAAHQRGETLEPASEAEARGNRKNAIQEMNDKEKGVHDAIVQTEKIFNPQLQMDHDLAVERLRMLGVNDPEEARAERTKALGVKQFFKKLFNKKAREIEAALDAFARASDALGNSQGSRNESENLLANPHQKNQALEDRRVGGSRG